MATLRTAAGAAGFTSRKTGVVPASGSAWVIVAIKASCRLAQAYMKNCGGAACCAVQGGHKEEGSGFFFDEGFAVSGLVLHDHLFRQLVGHVIVMGELHRVRSPPLRHGG